MDDTRRGRAGAEAQPLSRAPSTTAILASVGLFWLGLYLYVPILTPFAAKVSGSAGLAGLVVASYGVPQVLTRIALAGWADRLGRRQPFMLGGLLLAAISAVGMAAVPTGAGLLVFRTLSGVAASTWAMFSMQYASRSGASTATAMSRLSFMNNAGQVVAVLAGGVVAARLGMTAPFWCAAVVAMLGLGLVAGVPERAPSPVDAAPAAGALVGVRRAMATGDVVRASILGAIAQAVAFATTFGYLPLWAARHGVTPSGLGLLTASNLVPAALASRAGGAGAVRRRSPGAVLGTAFALLAVGTGAVTLVGVGPLLFAAQVVAGAGRGLLTPALMSLSVRRVEERWRTTALATYQSVYAVGMVAGPLLAAAIVQTWGLSAVFGPAGLLALAGAVGAAVTLGGGSPRRPRRWAEEPAAQDIAR